MSAGFWTPGRAVREYRPEIPAAAISACSHFWPPRSWEVLKSCWSKAENERHPAGPALGTAHRGEPGGSSCLEQTRLTAVQIGGLTAGFQSKQSQLIRAPFGPLECAF